MTNSNPFEAEQTEGEAAGVRDLDGRAGGLVDAVHLARLAAGVQLAVRAGGAALGMVERRREHVQV